MKDLAKALFIGIALTAGFFIVPLVIAVLFPVVIFSLIVLVAWFLLKVIQANDRKEDDGETKKPP